MQFWVPPPRVKLPLHQTFDAFRVRSNNQLPITLIQHQHEHCSTWALPTHTNIMSADTFPKQVLYCGGKPPPILSLKNNS